MLRGAKSELVSQRDAQCDHNSLRFTRTQNTNSAATAAELVVGELPEGLALLDGSLKASLGKIDVGELRKHTYTLVAKKGALLHNLEAARVTYKPEKDAETQVGLLSCCVVWCCVPDARRARKPSSPAAAAAADVGRRSSTSVAHAHTHTHTLTHNTNSNKTNKQPK